jgi:hypothetical protein
MRDERDELLDSIFRKARMLTPDTSRVEEHFETRLMAVLAEKRSERDVWTAWTWRLVPWLAVIVLIVGIGNYTINPAGSGDPFASLTSGDDDVQITSMISGG